MNVYKGWRCDGYVTSVTGCKKTIKFRWTMMQATRKIAITERQKESPLEMCLAIWLQWQRRSDMSLGWRGRSAMIESDVCADSQQLYDSMDNNTAQAVEASVCSLPLPLLWAIRRRCGLATVWRFPSLIFADVLERAEIELEKKLRNNIATRNLFN